jgi:hypothetical protein
METERQRLEARRDHLNAMIKGAAMPGRRMQRFQSQVELARVEAQLEQLPPDPDDG